MAQPSSNTTFVTGGGPDRLAAAVALHGEVFKTDPVIQWVLHTLPEPKRTAYVPSFLGTLLKAASLQPGCIFDEAWTGSENVPPPSASDDSQSAKPALAQPAPSTATGAGAASANATTRSSVVQPTPTAPPACSAVWISPGTKVDDWRKYWEAGFFPMVWNVGLSGLGRMMGSFQSESDRAKREGLVHPRTGERIKRFYYLFFIATDERYRGRGLSSEVIRRFQKIATGESTPIWLESTTERSHRLYLHLGFRDVKSWVLGEGDVDERGLKTKGGKGVRIWAMLWFPEGYVDVKVEVEKKGNREKGEHA